MTILNNLKRTLLMYRIFISNSNNFGYASSPLMPRLINLIDIQYKYQQDFYKFYGFMVPSQHILSRLVYLLSSYIKKDQDSYRMVSEASHEICSGLGITSDTTYGTIHNDAFYTRSCVLLSVTYPDSIPVILKESEWRDIRAVRCLTHPNLSMEVFAPEIIKSRLTYGLSVVGIDIPLLAYQLKQWMQFNDTLPPNEKEDIGQFLSKYVISGMVKEQIDIALRNRLKSIYKKKTPEKTTTERSYTVASEAALVGPIYRILEAIDTSRSRYIRALEEIPMIHFKTYLDAVPMYTASPSVYSYWVIMLLFLDWAYPMVTFINADQTNVSEISKILKRVDRMLISYNVIDRIPDTLKDNFIQKYKEFTDKFCNTTLYALK